MTEKNELGYTPRTEGVAGIYRPPNKDAFIVNHPQDLVANGIRVSVEAVRKSWGDEGVAIYQAAIIEDEQSPDFP